MVSFWLTPTSSEKKRSVQLKDNVNCGLVSVGKLYLKDAMTLWEEHRPPPRPPLSKFCEAKMGLVKIAYSGRCDYFITTRDNFITFSLDVVL